MLVSKLPFSIKDQSKDYYDSLWFYTAVDFSGFDFMTEKFYLLNSTIDNKFYFVSKETNVEDFIGSRIYIPQIGDNYDLGNPTETQNGYNFWDLEILEIYLNYGVKYNFQFWLRNRDDPEAWPKKTIVGGQSFEWYPLPTNATGAPIAGEPAKNGWKDNGGGTWGFINEMVYVSGDPTLLASWNIIT